MEGDDEVSAPSATGSGPIVATFTGGGTPCGFTGTTAFIGAPPGAPPLPPTSAARQSLLSARPVPLRARRLHPRRHRGDHDRLPAAVAAGHRYWRYGPTPGDPLPHWYELPATITGDTVVFQIADGGLGDDDLEVNGVILDQGGPGVPATTATDIPSLGRWGLVVLAALLAMVALRRTGDGG